MENVFADGRDAEDLIKEAEAEIQNPRAAFDLVIPGEVRILTTLNHQEKYLYAVIRNLCRHEGYCWATNEYLATQIDKDDRTVQRYIDKLILVGALTREIVQNKMYKRRRLWISGAYEKVKKPLVTTFLSPSSRHPCRDGHDTHVVYTKERYTEERKEERDAGARPAPPPLKKFSEYVQLSEEEYKQISETFTEDRLKEAIQEMTDYLKATGKKGYKDYAAALRNWLRRSSKATPHMSGAPSLKRTERRFFSNGACDPRTESENEELAKKVEKEWPSVVSVGYNYIEFRAGQDADERIKFSEHEFRDRVLNKLRKWNFDIEGLLRPSL